MCMCFYVLYFVSFFFFSVVVDWYCFFVVIEFDEHFNPGASCFSGRRVGRETTRSSSTLARILENHANYFEMIL